MANKNIFDSNLTITKAVVDKGEIKTLEINGEDIPMVDPEVVVQDTKEVSVTENGSIDIEPDSGYDAIGKVELTVAVEAADIEANKEATIDASTYTEPVEITPTAGKDGMAKATVTLTNIPSGADLESNHAATIDASTYTEPVEITPTSGKDGMEKVTVTITNIPEEGVDVAKNLYCWSNTGDASKWIYSLVNTGSPVQLYYGANSAIGLTKLTPGSGYTSASISGNTLTITGGSRAGTYNHYASSDIIIGE